MTTLFAPDGYGDLARIGLVYMASSTVMEPEMYAMAGRGVSIHTSRVTLPKVTVDGIDAMMHSPELESSVRLLAQAPLDVIVFGGTSASFLHGTAWDYRVIEQMRSWSGGSAECVTTSTATLAALKEVGAGPVALATPYVPEIVDRAARFLGENGHPVVSSTGLDITSDHALAQVSPQQVYDLAKSVDTPEASAVFISCTNLRSVGVVAALEQELGKPVVSAVQASFWYALRVAGAKGAKPGYGSLFAKDLQEEGD